MIDEIVSIHIVVKTVTVRSTIFEILIRYFITGRSGRRRARCPTQQQSEQGTGG